MIRVSFTRAFKRGIASLLLLVELAAAAVFGWACWQQLPQPATVAGLILAGALAITHTLIPSMSTTRRYR